MMLKYSISEMHKFNNVTFFRGKNKFKKSEDYLYLETLDCFGKENLACHLFEYEEKDVLSLDFKNNKKIQDVISSLKEISDIKYNVFDTSIGTLDKKTDVQFEYHHDFFAKEDIEIFESILIDETNFNISFKNIKYLKEYDVKNVDASKFAMVKVIVSDNFMKERSRGLSECFAESFDANRYVDTQILFFFIMTSLKSLKT